MERHEEATPMAWDEHSYQGRTREQVAASHETMVIIFWFALAGAAIWALVQIGRLIHGLLP